MVKVVTEAIMNFLDLMLKAQYKLQKELNKNAKTLDLDKIKTVEDVKNYILFNKMAIDAEFFELIESLGGGDNAVWKQWKSKYNDLNRRIYNKLPEEQQYKIKEEMIDILHFILNILLVLGLDSETIYEIYMKKNRVNLQRIENKY